MNRYALRVAGALLTFTIGIALVAVWVIKWRNPVSISVNSSAIESKAAPSETNISSDMSDEYAVYSTVLAGKRYIDKGTKQVIISDETVGYLSPEDDEKDIIAPNKSLEEEIPELEQSTLNDYETKNDLLRPSQLENLFSLKVKTILISHEEIYKLIDTYNFIKRWRIINQKYPGSKGLIFLSRVGFNPEKTQAWVRVGIDGGPGRGEGDYFFLENENGVWNIRKKQMSWVEKSHVCQC